MDSVSHPLPSTFVRPATCFLTRYGYPVNCKTYYRDQVGCVSTTEEGKMDELCDASQVAKDVSISIVNSQTPTDVPGSDTKTPRLAASCRVLGTVAVLSTKQQAHTIHQALRRQSRLILSFPEKSCLYYPKSIRLSKNLYLFLSMKLCLPPPMNLCQPAFARQMALQPRQSAPHLQKPRTRKRS